MGNERRKKTREGVGGLRSKVDEVREKSPKCTLLENAVMISNIWHANFKGLIVSRSVIRYSDY